MKLKIKRKTWLRGEGAKDSYLHRLDDDKQCCLGKLSLACGYKVADIAGRKYPYEVAPVKRNKIFQQLLSDDTKENSKITTTLSLANDSENLSEPKREARVKKLMAQIGVEVSFVD